LSAYTTTRNTGLASAIGKYTLRSCLIIWRSVDTCCECNFRCSNDINCLVIIDPSFIYVLRYEAGIAFNNGKYVISIWRTWNCFHFEWCQLSLFAYESVKTAFLLCNANTASFHMKAWKILSFYTTPTMSLHEGVETASLCMMSPYCIDIFLFT
jgi:hypothetical protein